MYSFRTFYDRRGESAQTEVTQLCVRRFTSQPGVMSGSGKVKCWGEEWEVWVWVCGWEERGMGLKKAVWRKDEKESRRRERAALCNGLSQANFP